MRMYLLRFFEKDELENMAVSHDVDALKHQAREDWPNKISFKKEKRGNCTFIYEGNLTVGVIGPTREIM